MVFIRHMENLYSVLIAVVSVLGSAGAFRYYEKRAMNKERDDDFIKHDCKDRISKLEALLALSSREKDDLRQMVLDLTKQVAALTVKVEYLTKENEDLHKKRRTTTR
jgi:uncharacterized coiled-coil protein SlyX